MRITEHLLQTNEFLYRIGKKSTRNIIQLDASGL